MIRRHVISLILLLAGLAAVSCAKSAPESKKLSDDEYIARGRYLTTVLGCGDCHTPGYFYGAPDTTRKFAGSELGWGGPWGVTYPRNLTPEPGTGIAAWSEDDIMNAIRMGKRPDGTAILPPMPWVDFAYLTDEDARAVAKYLKSVPPVMHKAPAVIPPGGKVTGAVMMFPPPPAWDAPKTQ